MRDITQQALLWDEAMQRQAERHGAEYVDTLPWFCAHGRCPLVVDNVVVYRDQDHITTTYADLLTPQLERAVFG